ncbi:alpha-xylosidase [Cellulosilyticum sp. I15G10I2]|uniref:alpha-xylosidase n=1 Tax=Cellulosilyticum sp. I15G10I2 TaxID=1892843 RepID=UPI00085CB04A|nr:alpha-xylosidase [Cellulosilyticum sp. I15G10I2]
MKFTDGQWLNKDKHTLLHPQQVFDVKHENDTLAVYVFTQFAPGRAKTLDQGTLTIRLSSPQENIIKVCINHFEGIKERGPVFPLNIQSNIKTAYEEDEKSITFITGKTKAVIQKEVFTIAYFYEDKKLTGSLPKCAAYINNEKDEKFIREQLSLTVGECVYGLGERFTPFVKNGQVVEMWNEDGGTSSELAYKNIPFYITNQNYGVFINHPEKVSFEVASEQVERVQFSVPGEKLEYFIIGGSNMREVIANYTALSGKPALPPAWSFGLWLTTSFTTSYDENTVNEFIEGMFSRDLPLHVFHFDCFWMKEVEWCNFEWDESVFKDPEAMLRRLKDKGLKICVWINPYIAQKSKLFKEGMEKGYLVKLANGDVWQWDRWQAGMGLVDFTNPAASEWYQEKLKALLDMGVDSFKTDFGERIPTQVVYYDGSDPIKMHNFYTYLYNEAVFDLLVRERGANEAALFARSATACAQKFPIHWGGDCWATYESMAESLRGGLSLCMSGFGFWSHDISGFENLASPDIYKRWVAFGLLSTHSRLHGSSSYRVPWLFDEEAVEVLRYFTNLKCKLMPYLYNEAYNTSQTGYPMMRSMVMDFNEPACKYLDTQYMLGESLMVAPIFNNEGKVSYYLPEGKWMNFLTGKTLEGGRYYTETHDYMSIPLMVKANTLIAIGHNDHDVVYDYAECVEVQLIHLEEGQKASAVVRDHKGEIELIVKAVYYSGVLTVTSEGVGKPWTLLLRNIDKVTAAVGCNIEGVIEGSKVTPTDYSGTITIAY